MQNFLSLWFNAGAQITHGGQVQRPRQNNTWATFNKLWMQLEEHYAMSSRHNRTTIFCLKKVSKTFINTNAPIFRHRIASKTEKHSETSRNQQERPFSSFALWIDMNWNQLGPRRRSIDLCFDLLSPVKSLESEQSAVLAFYAGAQNAHVGQIKRPREMWIFW